MSSESSLVLGSSWMGDLLIRAKGRVEPFLKDSLVGFGKRFQQILSHSNALLIFSKIQGIAEWIESGVQVEVTRATRYFSKSEHVRTLYDVFQKSVAYLPFEKKTQQTELETPLTGAALLESEVHRSAESIVLEEEPPLFSEPQELRKLSRLKKDKAEVGIPIEREVISSLFGRVSRENFRAFTSLISYVGEFLNGKLESNPLRPPVKSAFELAMERERDVTALILEEKDKSENIQNRQLQAMAKIMSEDVKKLSEDQPFLYFGRMSEAGAPRVPSFFDSFLKDQLPQQVYEFMQSDSTELLEKVKGHIVRNLEEEGLVSDQSGEVVRKVRSAITGVMEKTSGMMRQLNPQFYETLAGSLQEDLRELAVGPRSSEGSKRVAEDMWDRMVEQGFEKAIEETVTRVLSESKGFIQDHVEEVVGEVTRKMPKVMLRCLSASGFHLHQGENFWIEMEKQGDGKYTLRLFSNDLGSDFHSAVAIGQKEGFHLPLVFTDVEADKLGDDFFFRLLSYQAWPEWGKGVTYSLQNLHEGLLDSLGRQADDPVPATVFPDSMTITDRLADWFRLYLHHHLEMSEGDFSKTFYYDLPLQALIDFWPHIHEKPELLKQFSMRKELEQMVDQLSEGGVGLYREGKITLEELKSLYGTVWEVQEALRDSSESQETMAYGPSIVVPPQMQGFIKELLVQTGVTPTHIEALKEVFMALMGEEFEETFDLVIKEVIPRLVKEQEVVKVKEMSWSEVFGIEGIKNYVTQVRSMRLSILHIYRACAQASSVITHILGFSIAAKLVETLLSRYFPHINTYSYLSTKRLAPLLAYFGPSVLEKVLPRDVYKVFKAFFGLYEEIFSYIRRRIALTVLRCVMYHALGKEEVASLNHAAKMLQQQLTREGEVTFDLPKIKPLGSRIEVRLANPHKTERLSGSEKAVQATFFSHRTELPRPKPCVVDQINLITKLELWNSSAVMVARDNGFGLTEVERIRQAANYLNGQIRNLPIPDQEGGEIWQKHGNPTELLEHVHLLLCKLHNYSSTVASMHESVERMTSLYTLYAIIDALARRCESAHIPDDLRANGRVFAYWMGSPAIKVVNPRTYARFKEVAAYFGLDPLKKYTLEELDTYEAQCLFNFNGVGTEFQPSLVNRGDTHISQMGALYSSGSDYYRRLLEDERVQLRLAAHGVTEETPFLEKMTLLFRDPSLKEAVEEMKNCVLSEAKIRRSNFLAAKSSAEQSAGYLSIAEDAVRNAANTAVSAVLPSAITGQLYGQVDLEEEEEEITVKDITFQEELDQQQRKEAEERRIFDEEEDLALVEAVKKEEDLKVAMRRLTSESPLDCRHGILPRPFYFLRLAHLMTQDIGSTSASCSKAIQSFHNDPVVTGLSIKAPIDRVDSSNWFDRACLYARTKFHEVTSHLFRNQKLNANIPLFFSQERDVRIDDLAMGRIPSGSRGSETGVGSNSSSSRWQGREIEEQLIHSPSERSQSEIMLKGPLEFGDLLPEEKRILEMINTYQSDQVARALSFFTDSRDRLTDPRFRSLFDIFVNNIPALEAQLEERPAITKDIGDYFTETIKHFKRRKDWGTCLYLAKVGSEMLVHCHRYNKDATDHFPNFSLFILNEVAPSYRARKLDSRQIGELKDGLLVSYCYLVSSYLHLDPNEVSASKKREVMQVIARLAYSQIPWQWTSREEDVLIKSRDVIYLWEPHIKAAMEGDITFRNEVLNELLLDVGLDPETESGDWEGDYPQYRKGMFPVNLEFSSQANQPGSNVDLLQKIKDLTGILPSGAPQTVGQMVFFNTSGLFVKQTEGQLEIYKDFDGKRFRFLRPAEVVSDAVRREEHEALWMEVGKEAPVILVADGTRVIERLVVEEEEGGGEHCYTVIRRERNVDGTFVNEADLSGCEHGLSLLSWFQPSSAIRTLTSRSESGNVLERIEFPKVDLAYDIREINGERQAVDASGKTPGFYIAKKQRDPRLMPYSNYLLLENVKREKKVHLIAHSFEELMGLYFIKNVGQVSTSPLVESGVKNLLAEAEMGQKERVFTYSLNSQGDLESSDPEALAYLMFFHMAQGRVKESLLYFEQLQDWGRRYPFPPEVFSTLDQFLIPLLVAQTVEAEKLLLQIVAIREENSLVHQQAEVSPTKLDVLRWLAVQMKYYNYLERIKRGARPYLSHYDELFLLKAVGRQNRKLFETQFKDAIGQDKGLGWIKMIGIDSMADHLMMAPSIAQRYHALREQHGEGSQWSRRAEAMLLHGVFGEAAPSAPSLSIVPENVIPALEDLMPPPAFTRRTSLFSRVLSTYKKAASHPFMRHNTCSHLIGYSYFFHAPDVEEVSTELHRLTPRYLTNNFLSFYRLAMKEIPEEWKGDTQKEALFAKKTEEFHRNLPLLQGDISSSSDSLFFAVLRTIAQGTLLSILPNSEELDRSFVKIGEYNNLMQAQDDLWKLIEEKGCTRSHLKWKKEHIESAHALTPSELEHLPHVGEYVLMKGDRPLAEEYEKVQLELDTSMRKNPFYQLSMECNRLCFRKAELYEKIQERGFLRSKVRSQVESTPVIERTDLHQYEWTEEELVSLPSIGEYVLPEMDRSLVEEFKVVELKLQALRSDRGQRVLVPSELFDEKIKKMFDQCRVAAAAGSLSGFVQVRSLTDLQTAASQGFRATTAVARRWFNAQSGISTLQYAQMLINFALSLGTGLWHKVRQVRHQEELAQVQRVEREQNALVCNATPAAETFVQGMTQREEAITRVMEGLLENYYDVEQLPSIEEEKDRAAPYVVGEEEEEEAVRAGFAKLSQSLEDFYARPEPSRKRYRLRADKKAEDLGKDLDQLRSQVVTRLEAERRDIEGYVNHKFSQVESEEEALLNRFAKRKAERGRLTFKEIDDAFIQEKDPELISRTFMKEEHLPELKKRLYLYHVMASRWNLLFERIGGLSEPSESALEVIGTELDRRRVYSFADIPERLLRGKLVFESRTRKMLWSKQSSQIDRLLLSSHFRLVVELIMGSGKTWYGIPLSDFFGADGNAFVINIWPAPVAGTNIATIGRQAKDIFAQVANALHITRSMKWTKDKLWGIKRVFERTRLEHQQMNMTKESLQALELCFIEQGLDLDHTFSTGAQKSLWKESLEFFRETLKLVRLKGKGHVDEFHVASSRRKELNHPLGKARRMEKQFVEVIEETLFQLVASPEFRETLTIKAEKPSPLSQEEFKTKILPILAVKMASFPGLEIEERNQVAFASYVSGIADSIPTFVARSKKRSEIALVKGLLTVLLPNALEKTIHVDFNPSKEGNGEYARPSEGNDNPLEQSTIRSPFEALVKSGLLLAHDRLNPEQLNKLISFLKGRARLRARKDSCPLEATREAKFFAAHCTGYELFTFEETDCAEVHRLLNQSDRAIFAYLTHFVAKQIRYFGLNLSSNSSNFNSMFAEILADTGTPFNDGSYPVGTRVLSDPGTDGESVDVMEMPGKSTIHILEKEAPEEVLDELIIRFFEANSDARAYIDRGAALNGMASDKVARRLLTYITENRPELEGIAFYLNRELVILEKGATKPIPIDQSTIPVEKRLSYFPQPQTYAADIPQIEGATGIISIGEDLCFNELAQAVWRMRGLKRLNQKMSFVMTERVRKKVSGDRMPTIRDIIAFAQRNENRILADDNYQADKQKLQNVIRRAVLDKVIFAPTIDNAIEIFQAFKDVFVSKVEDDPFLLFGFIDGMVGPAEIFSQMRQKLYNLVHKSKYFTDQERREIFTRLSEIGEGKYPELVHTYLVDDEVDAGRLDDLGKTSQVEESGDEDVDRDEEIEMDLHQELNQNLHQIETTVERPRAVQTFCEWPKTLNPTKLDWLTITDAPHLEDGSCLVKALGGLISPLVSRDQNVPLFTLRDVLSKTGREESVKISAKVTSAILVSNNVAHMIAKNGYPVEPFGRDQIPIFEALVIKRGTEKPQMLLIDQKEAAYWREKLAEDREGKYERDPSVKIGLYDISRRMLVAEGHNRFTDELSKFEFNRAIVQVKFLRGDVLFDENQCDILRPWLKSRLRSLIRYSEFVREKHARRDFAGSKLEEVIFELENQGERGYDLRI